MENECKEIYEKYKTLRQLSEEFVLKYEKESKNEKFSDEIWNLKKELENARKEVIDFLLVDFEGEKIHRYEKQALERIVEEINEGREGRRVITIEELASHIETKDESIIGIEIIDKNLSKAPKSLSKLVNLKKLFLDSNVSLSDISVLSGLVNLEELSLFDSPKLSDISALRGMVKLESLDLSENENLSNISALSGLVNLKVLHLRNTNIPREHPENLKLIEKWEKLKNEGKMEFDI